MNHLIQTDMLTLSQEALQALLPYALVFAGAVAGIFASVSKRTLGLVPVISLVALGAAAWASATLMGADATLLFGRTLASDPYGQYFNLIFLGSAAAVTVVSYRYLQRQGLEHGEYYVLILLATLGMMLLASAQDLIVLFLGLELMSFSIYALVGFRRADKKSNEAALKYFILGSAASAILLYGAALLYGSTETLQLKDLWNSNVIGRGTLVYTLGAWLLVVGFLFKVAAVPFHMWMPDVYEGAPTPITAFMTTGVKVAAFASFLRVYLAMEPASAGNPLFFGNMDTLVRLVAIATMLLGNVLAVAQTNLKRMLAYSSIAHTGYLLLGFLSAADGVDASASIMLYLLTYAVMTMGAFSVLSALSGRNDDGLELSQVAGLAGKRPALAFALAVFLFSLAGMPPTAGFVAKYSLFYGAVQAGEIPLVIIAVLCSLISVFYYLRVLVFVYMKEPSAQIGSLKVSRGIAVAATALVILTLQIGVLPQRWLDLIRVLHLP